MLLVLASIRNPVFRFNDLAIQSFWHEYIERAVLVPLVDVVWSWVIKLQSCDMHVCHAGHPVGAIQNWKWT
jgi:hypothetical protein